MLRSGLNRGYEAPSAEVSETKTPNKKKRITILSAPTILASAMVFLPNPAQAKGIDQLARSSSPKTLSAEVASRTIYPQNADECASAATGVSASVTAPDSHHRRAQLEVNSRDLPDFCDQFGKKVVSLVYSQKVHFDSGSTQSRTVLVTNLEAGNEYQARIPYLAANEKQVSSRSQALAVKAEFMTKNSPLEIDPMVVPNAFRTSTIPGFAVAKSLNREGA